MAILAGKASGKARRRKADFRKTLNMILTSKVKADEWEDMLSETGLDCTPESIMNMVVVQKAIQGDLDAYNVIRDVIKTQEQLEKQKNEIKKQKMEIEKLKSQLYGQEEELESESDGFIEALKGTAAEAVGEGADFIET